MEAVLPPKGLYCVIGIKGKNIHSQTFHKTLRDVDVAVDLLDAKHINSFVALATFQDNTSRTADNVAYLKSFFLDLDCDPDCGEDHPRKYKTQELAAKSIIKFVKDLNLPRPMMVNSGYGLHAYWPLTEPITRTAWKVVAERLKTVCMLSGLKIDPAVPADAARVLRAVGSTNWKSESNPLSATVLREAEAVEVELLRTLLGVTATTPTTLFNTPYVKRQLDDVTKSLLENNPSSFKMIAVKSFSGTGCNQIRKVIEDPANTSEPEWRAVLSIAQFCKDRDRAIHIVSSGHPGYNPQETEQKASRIPAPHRCETFRGNNPSRCEGCKHEGKIGSPISLGRGEVEQATAADNIVKDVLKPDLVYTIPEYPFPFVRGKNGGIYIKGKDDDDHPKDVLVYENDFYLVHTVEDPFEGMSGLFRLHLPQDGVKEFHIPLKEMITKDGFGKRVAEQGISTIAKQMESLMAYGNMSIKTYQKARKAEKSRTQFGWADNHSVFIIGDREVSATGVKYSPPSAVTVGQVKSYAQKGSLEEWKKIAAFYNKPGREMFMFVLFAGFGSPLVPFSNQNGGVISLFSEGSGTGKTTILQMINSIFGHPEDLMLIKADTMNSRINRIGTMQNITTTLDEITNESPEVTSDFLYQFLQARGKNRLHNSLNIERHNTIYWKAHCVVTANNAMEDKLYVKKRAPDGELARFLEFPLSPITGVSKVESDAIFALLSRNYGWAGEAYVQHVIRTLPKVQEALEKMQRNIDASAGLTQRERHWSSMATTTLTGGLIARNAGVMDFVTDDDYQRVHGWAIKMLKEKRKATAEAIYEPSLMLGAFLSEHINDMLIINSGASRVAGSPQDAPIREPRGKLYARYEPDSKLLFVGRARFREFCMKNGVSYASVIKHLTDRRRYLGEKKMRMGKGLQVSAPEAALMFLNEGQELFDSEAIHGDARSTHND